MVSVNGTVCWVSGAAQGIGHALCRRLIDAGAKVLMVDMCSTERGSLLAHELNKAGKGNAVFYRADLTDFEQLRAALEEPKLVFGSPARIVFGNAGIAVNDEDKEKAVAMFKVNTIGVILGTQIAVELMIEAGIKGVIVNTASMAGLLPVPVAPMYAASKWAVVGYTHSVSDLCKRTGIRICAVCPNVVDTPAVGRFFHKEFSRPTATRSDKLLVEHIMDTSVVADVFMKIVADDTVAAKCIVVHPKKRYVHDSKFRLLLGQLVDDSVPDYISKM